MKWSTTVRFLSATIHDRILDPRDIPVWICSLLLASRSTQWKYPWLPFTATRWLKLNLRKDMRVLEWGAGASTCFISPRVHTLVSVEHDRGWFLDVKTHLAEKGYSNVDLQFRPCTPMNGSDLDQRYCSAVVDYSDASFKHYCDVINEYPDGYFDLVLIDGRAREACLINALAKIKRPGIVILDNSDRPRYQSVLALFEDRTDFKGVSPGTRAVTRTSVCLVH